MFYVFFFFSFLLRLLFIFPHLLPPTYPCLPIEIYMIIFFIFFCTTCVCPPFLTRYVFSNQISPLGEWGRRKVLYASLACVFLSFYLFIFIFNLWGYQQQRGVYLFTLLLFATFFSYFIALPCPRPWFSFIQSIHSISYHT